jgi:polyisoprenyl-phosphate glycosyltransferase
MRTLDVVVPVYNEASSLALLVDEIKARSAHVSNISKLNIIFVDDGSSDSSWKRICDLSVHHLEVSGIRLTRNFGKEAALRAGLEATNADYVLIMDADLQHPPALIPKFIEIMQDTQCEIVSGVRGAFKTSGLFRLVASRLYNWIFSGLAGLEMSGATDFKLLSRNAVSRYCQLKERRLFFRGLTKWLGLHEETIEFDVPITANAVSAWSLGALTNYAIRNTTAFSTVPLQLVLWMGAVSLLFSVALTVQTLANKLTGNATQGFTTIIIAVSFFGGLTLLGLGIVGIYIAALYDEVKGRPIYLVAEVARNASRK